MDQLSLLLIASVSIIIFIFLRPRYQVLLAFFIMTYNFDLTPWIVFRIDVWDAGAVLLIVAGVRLFLTKAPHEPVRAPYITALKVFIIWLGLCLLWSITVYEYPVLDSLKVSRQLIIGYCSFFVFLRLFQTDREALNYFLKFFFWSTLFLMVLNIIQYIMNTPITFGLVKEYRGVLRFLPVYISIILLNVWIILSRIFAGAKVKYIEYLYLLLAVISVAITFTRGIYLTFILVSMLMFFIVLIHRKVAFKSILYISSGLVVLVFVLALMGGMDKAISRTYSSFDLIFKRDTATYSKADYDTFTGRLLLTAERFDLALKHNPVFGYGFIHEENIKPDFRKKLKYGSVIETPRYKKLYALDYPYVFAFYSADIGWANIINCSGIAGMLIFIVFLASFLFSIRRNAALKSDKYFFLQIGFYLQIVACILLMFNGTTLTFLVQIPAFMLAGYAWQMHLAGKDA